MINNPEDLSIYSRLLMMTYFYNTCLGARKWQDGKSHSPNKWGVCHPEWLPSPANSIDSWSRALRCKRDLIPLNMSLKNLPFRGVFFCFLSFFFHLIKLLASSVVNVWSFEKSDVFSDLSVPSARKISTLLICILLVSRTGPSPKTNKQQHTSSRKQAKKQSE